MQNKRKNRCINKSKSLTFGFSEASKVFCNPSIIERNKFLKLPHRRTDINFLSQRGNFAIKYISMKTKTSIQHKEFAMDKPFGLSKS
ncbi:MAG: hypothetical protein ACTS4Y_00380 [Candidatus Hodgkinia cicadicola]